MGYYVMIHYMHTVCNTHKNKHFYPFKNLTFLYSERKKFYLTRFFLKEKYTVYKHDLSTPYWEREPQGFSLLSNYGLLPSFRSPVPALPLPFPICCNHHCIVNFYGSFSLVSLHLRACSTYPSCLVYLT